MNISKYRNSYLIDKAYRLTLVSVLTMICERGGSVLAAGQLAYGYREHLKHPSYTMFSMVDKLP